jgi:hypothetical protein
MAVVQISRIQIRRGQKNQGSGLPQLASGELAWAIDSQELFVGNGAVSEGAPYVGNTKVLTEHDNLLDLINQYVYKDFLGSSVQTGVDPNFPIERSVQERLDERVSVLAFGAIGDGSTDNTAALQRAIDQLFLNPATITGADSRVILEVPAGTYNLSSPLYIPSYCNIVGAGLGKTIFRHLHSDSAFIFVNDTSVIGTYSSSLSAATVTYNNQAKFIRLEGFSIRSIAATETMMLFNAVRDSSFTDIELDGTWVSLSGSDSDSVGIKLQSVSDLVTCERLYFSQFKISGLSYGVFSKHDINRCVWDQCEFDTLYRGVSFGQGTDLFSSGQLFGPRQCMVKDSRFTNIDREGFIISTGNGNLSRSNQFKNVGNDGSTNLNAVTSHVKFNSKGNSTQNDWFDRADDLSESNFTKKYFTALEGFINHQSNFIRSVNVTQQGSQTTLFRLPYYASAGYEVNYVYQSYSNGSSQQIMKKGTLHIAVDSVNGNLQVVDDFNHTGTAGTEYAFQLFASLVNTDGIGGVDTIVVYYTNSTVSDNGRFNFTYTVTS